MLPSPGLHAPRSRITCAEDVTEEFPTPVRAALVQAEKPEVEQRNLLAAAALNGSEKKLFPDAQRRGTDAR